MGSYRRNRSCVDLPKRFRFLSNYCGCCCIDLSDGTWPSVGPMLVSTQSSGTKVLRHETSEQPSCCQVSSVNENKAKNIFRKYPSGIIKYPFDVHLLFIFIFIHSYEMTVCKSQLSYRGVARTLSILAQAVLRTDSLSVDRHNHGHGAW